MNDPLIARFAEACGATGPLHLRVELTAGGVLAEGSVHQPFLIVGRDDSCEVTLTDPDVNLRHAWVQVVGGRAFAIDLGTRAGLVWPSGARASGWVVPGEPVRLGPFALRLRQNPSAEPNWWGDEFNPMVANPVAVAAYPPAALEFRNGRRARDRWPVNRVVTLIGRAPECKIHLNADEIALYHCGLVLTPVGLWVVDLSGRGVVVNGERMRVAPLPPGAELLIERFQVRCEAATRSPTPRPRPNPAPRLVEASAPPPPERASAGTVEVERAETREGVPVTRPTPRPSHPPAGVPDDEVPLGIQPPRDPNSGLPSSHIMADAFRRFLVQAQPGGSSSTAVGPLTGGESAAGAELLAEVFATPAPVAPRPAPAPAVAAGPPSGITLTPEPAALEAVAAPLLRQFAEVHGQMMEQFQQSVLAMMQAFGQMHQEQMTAMQAELARIQELNGELMRLQVEVARQAMTHAAAPYPTPPTALVVVEPPRPTVIHAGPDSPRARPFPGQGAPQAPAAQAAMQNWVFERLNALQQERQSRWQKLVGFFGPAGKT